MLRRLRLLLWCFALLFAAVEARLVYLQFHTRAFWQSEARATRTTVKTVPFRRGAIYDRLGRPLAVGRPVHSLSFVFGRFRRESPAGRLLGALRILERMEANRADGDAPAGTPLAEVLRDPGLAIYRVLSVRPEQLDPLPRAARDDYGFYARRLLGLSEAELRARLEEEGGRARPFARRQAELEAVVADVARQRAALDRLARALALEPDAFVARLDEEIAAVEREVGRAAEHAGSDGETASLRALRRDIEHRERPLVAAVDHAAVLLVDVAPAETPGLEVAAQEQRLHPEEFAGLSPLLVGFTRAPRAADLARTEEHRQLELELKSLPPESVDGRAAELMMELRLRLRESDYRPDEEQGQAGLEGLLEPWLRGRRGWRVVEQDAAQRDTQLLEMSPPVDGQDMQITLDATLQLAAERVLARRAHPGAIVLLSPEDGAILALATWPQPSREALRQSYGELVEDARGPLFQRAYQVPGNPPPPGSTFKAVAAAAALEAGTADAGTTFRCEGSITVGATTLRCTGVHGDCDVVRALQKSCNVWFYRAADALGFDRLQAMARRFGLGEATGFGDPARLGLGDGALALNEFACPIDVSGSGSRSFAMRSGIGQGGFDDCTPLQVAAMMAPFANGGFRVRPWLVARAGDRRLSPPPRDRIGLAAESLSLIRTGLERVCEAGGTAEPDAETDVDLRPWQVAGKTGTAEEANAEEHAWFAGYLPRNAPRLVFAVFLQNVGLHGGEAAAPLLNRLLEQPEVERFLAEGAP